MLAWTIATILPIVLAAPTFGMEWIHQEHLHAGAGARHGAELASSAQHVVVLDRFLCPNALARLQARMRSGSYRTVYNLRGRGRCSKAELESAHDALRLGCYLDLEPLAERSVEQELAHVLSSAGALEYFGQIARQELGALSTINCSAHEHGHYLRTHSDSDGGRRLCAVLYLHPQWEPAFGGSLVFNHGLHLPLRIDPLCNRLVIFEPGAGFTHAVEPVTHPHWQRWSLSFWFV